MGGRNRMKSAKNLWNKSDWICIPCGKQHGIPATGSIVTFNEAVCGWCGEKKSVTAPRNYGYPPLPRQSPLRSEK